MGQSRVSFVKSPEVFKTLNYYISARSSGSQIAIIANIESIDSLEKFEKDYSGNRLSYGSVGRSRAEVADISQALGQGADALMLSSEMAMGQYPDKGISCNLRIERRLREEKHWDATDLQIVSSSTPARISKEICLLSLLSFPPPPPTISHGADYVKMVFLAIFIDGAIYFFLHRLSDSNGNKLFAIVFSMGSMTFFFFNDFQLTNSKQMPSLFTQKPDRQRLLFPAIGLAANLCIYPHNLNARVQRWLNLQWVLIPFFLDFSDDVKSNLNRTFSLLRSPLKQSRFPRVEYAFGLLVCVHFFSCIL
ncbi:hypothetical protein DITRI_Ditri11bG0085600 [Diplodiscus trichospermus]